ncbi:MAG: archaeal flagellar protein FlaJ [Candidatus Diapherotrites archaeon]|nr:archaeal flagellar protein FlaJ [Candidatus Diapherotrites archaeon]MDN5366729.1 archaeal flagellar protein FlaJ [Candidatus Diapherotrites archaeon]
MRGWGITIVVTLAVAGILYSIKPVYAAIALLLPPAYAVYSESARYWRIRKMENELPRALLELATLPTHTLRDVIKYLSRGYGPLSEEFRRMDALVRSGIPPERAMKGVAEQSGSVLLESAVNIIITGVRSGSRWSDLIRGAAEDIEAVIEIEREKSSALALQKYVTLVSAGVFVPAALGITRRMVVRLTGEGPLTGGPTLLAIQDAVWVHIIALSLLTAIFVSLLEGRPRRALFYAAILLPLSLGTYVLSGGFRI